MIDLAEIDGPGLLDVFGGGHSMEDTMNSTPNPVLIKLYLKNLLRALEWKQNQQSVKAPKRKEG